MQPRSESTSALEASLHKTLLADLIEREANDYVSIEIVREPSELAKTGRFRRTPTDHLLTTRFSRPLRSAEPEELGTVPYEKQSEPYERIDIQPEEPPKEPDDSIPFLQIDVWQSGELIASSKLVALDDEEPADPADTFVDIEVQVAPPAAYTAPPNRWVRPLVVITVLVSAFAIGLGVPFLL